MNEYISTKEDSDGKSENGDHKINEQSFRIPLNSLSQKDIIQIFDNLNSEGRKIVIPIGFPQAGKSLFLSSLMYYSEKCPDKKWEGNCLSQYPYDNGNRSRNLMIQYLDNKEAYPASIVGTLDLIGLNIEPHKKSLPVLKLAFLDLAGEDVKKIKTDESGEFSPQIEGILKACELGNPIFCLITPYKPSTSDSAENALHKNFLDYLRERMPDLYHRSKFIVIVSQWDKKPVTEKLEVDEYIKQKRPALYTAMQSRQAKIVYGEFSVGKLFDTFDGTDEKGNPKPVVLIQRIDSQYPRNFWNNLYKLATGKSLVNEGWFDKLFGL